MNKADLIEFEKKVAEAFERGEIKAPIKIPCKRCGKQIGKYSKTQLCSSCWKIGRKRSVKSIKKQFETRALRYKNTPGGFNKGEHHCIRKEFKLNHIPWNKGKPFLTGKLHPMYIDGRTPLRHKLVFMPEYKEWRDNVFSRDEYICQTCGAKGDIEAHHIIPLILILRYLNVNTIQDVREHTHEIFDVSIGKTLCKTCHNSIPRGPNGRDDRGRFRGF